MNVKEQRIINGGNTYLKIAQYVQGLEAILQPLASSA